MALPRDLTPPHFPGWSPCFPPFRRAGVYARRTLANSKMEGLRHCRGRVFPVSRGPCPVRRGGFHIRPGRLCRRTVRRGEGTPLYGPPGRPWLSRLAQNIKFVRRGGIYCARRRVSEANRHAAAALRPENPPAEPRAAANRADMESAPTEVCGIAGVAFFRLVTGLAPVRRGGIYPARGCSRRREVRGTMRASSPTEVCNIAGFACSRLVTGLAPVRRGGIYPARGCSRRREVRGTMQASSPTKVCNNAGFAFSRLAAMLPLLRRAGIHARRTSKFAKKTLFCAFLNV